LLLIQDGYLGVFVFKIGSLAYDAQIDCTDEDGAEVFSGIVTVDELSFGADKKDLPDEICCAVKDNEGSMLQAWNQLTDLTNEWLLMMWLVVKDGNVNAGNKTPAQEPSLLDTSIYGLIVTVVEATGKPPSGRPVTSDGSFT
jgi:hypothetical protein